MPELPEVETTRRSIAPHLLEQRIVRVIVRERRFRWPINPELEYIITGQLIHAVERRAKYLLLRLTQGTALLHLGMSGSLRILRCGTSTNKHDHVDLDLSNGFCLRFTDPRRFGALLWTTDALDQHPLLSHLGPEPLADNFTADYLYRAARNRKIAIKPYIMDGRIVVGVGNIYANEALFLAGIHPQRAAGRLSKKHYGALVKSIREVLQEAIAQGGTTLRDFTSGDGEPGYFKQRLRVYGRDRQSCRQCGEPIQVSRLGQRATYYCNRCQR
ncbi:MAG: bifunctional DNA-formamidopyrimidine glycosylase/DNA-(apurinic or apyrimidinic site) lyase [Candidatus Competibacteraceae bacterium]|jgi:formamidopyrimidine-DNA glycosylase|nr:bifunctional DNA-formamidopyrimidine glycosylase/DNA-(apurinic or apyrimidinic site) lyase [Candidatus Competibacteraceae bacterium]